MLGAMPSDWKLGLTAALLLAVLASLAWRAPSDPVERGELRRLVASAVVLYAVGAAASLAGHGTLAGIVYASGILVCSLAVWLSRGTGRGDGPDGGGNEPPIDEGPPWDPAPDGLPPVDWEAFERERARWADRQTITS